MTALSNMNLSSMWINAILKGDGGAGKSIAGASFPKPMIIYDLDNRIKPLLTYYGDQPWLKDIEVKQYGAWDFVKFKDDFELQERRNDYATTQLSSLTALSRMGINYSMDQRGAREGKKKGVVDLTEIEDFGVEAQILHDVLDVGIALKGHFLVDCHVMTVESYNILKPGDKIVTRFILTAGKKIAAALPGKFDEIWHFCQKTNINTSQPPKRTVFTMNAGDDFAKTALPLPYEFEWTNHPNFYGIIEKATNEFLQKQKDRQAKQSLTK